MKNAKEAVCPGCSRHCPMHHLHCKYGKNYFAKKLAKEQEMPAEKHKHRWEKYVTDGGVVRQMIDVSRKTKKALCHEKITEAEVLAALNMQEREALRQTLDKISSVLKTST